MTERPQHELIASPWLTNGQIAAIKEAVSDAIETAESWLSSEAVDSIRTMARRGEPLVLDGLDALLTEEEAFNARYLYWLLQADRALMAYVTPKALLADGVVAWVDQNDQPIDTWTRPGPRPVD